MGRAYSQDIREAILHLANEGHTKREIARILGLVPSTPINIMKRYEQTGSLATAPIGRPKGQSHLQKNKHIILSYIKENPDITLMELSNKLKTDHNISAHISSLSRLLIKEGYSYKKNTSRRRKS